MFEMNFLRMQYILIGFAGGLVILIMAVLTYMTIWRQRCVDASGKPCAPASGLKGVWKAMPWVLILTYLGITVYSIIYAIQKILNPPNW